MHCKHCGLQIDDDSNYCSNCGGAVAPVGKVPVDTEPVQSDTGLIISYCMMVGIRLFWVVYDWVNKDTSYEERMHPSRKKGDGILIALSKRILSY